MGSLEQIRQLFCAFRDLVINVYPIESVEESTSLPLFVTSHAREDLDFCHYRADDPFSACGGAGNRLQCHNIASQLIYEHGSVQ